MSSASGLCGGCSVSLLEEVDAQRCVCGCGCVGVWVWVCVGGGEEERNQRRGDGK